MRPLASLCVCALLFSGCLGGVTAYDRARREDSSAAWARFLREHPTDPMAPQVKQRLGELEFQVARRQNGILAYKRFLAAHPDSDRKKDADLLLENLRFEVAAKADTPLAWVEFLRDHPAGAHGAEAKEKLDEADWKDAVKEGTAKAIADYVARHPESAHRQDADRMQDDRLFAEAQGAGPRALVAYLEKSGAGSHRDEARGALAEREATAKAFLGDFVGARRAAELVPAEAARRKVMAEIERAELDRVSAALDAKALEEFAFRHEGALADEAKARAKALAKDKALKGLAERLSPAHFARPEEELLRVLAAPDPRERWLAAEELGLMGARRTVDALLEAAATSRFSRVRERAFVALLALYALLPQEIKDVEARARLEAVRKVAQSPALMVKMALLEELLADAAAALVDYQKSMKGDQTDLFVLRRMLALKLAKGESFGAATAARELAGRVGQLLEQRAQEEGLSPLLLSRTLCGAKDDARAAVEALAGLSPQAARDFPEDLQLFQRRAAEVLRLTTARLSDAEADARSADHGFKGCDDDGSLHPRLAEGEADRLKVVVELSRRPEEAARQALSLSALHDPAAKVREAAKAALERGASR